MSPTSASVDEPLPVHIVVKDGTPCNGSDNQMVYCTGGIDAGMSRHEEMVSAGDSRGEHNFIIQWDVPHAIGCAT
jgi:hypothetical protein